ncbi:heavy metal translocating P-type ATPase [Terrimonas pollutisoli]|uniref:heavy metal translocating P-type ATPase n=1 Tax=Terrimonas pollutisoli TaxID=3034147 RepID=UPI0023EC0B87|nr:heavy metal translocating P-type ATPase [Terrimonas sp. H1YJ31]
MDHHDHHRDAGTVMEKKPQPAIRHERHEMHAAHDKHAGHHIHDFLKRFWICIGITIPVLFLSHMIQQWLGFELKFPGDKYLLLIFSTFIYFYGGMPFLKGMVSEIKDKAIGMMTLVAIAISVAFIYSVAVVVGLKGMDFFWELATLIDIMLLGHWLEMRSEMAASKALESLVALLPSIVHVERNGETKDINLKELQNGDTVLVKPGEKIPADGIVIDGGSYVNESMLTGESVPVKKEKEQTVIGGSVNGDGVLKVKITATGNDSYLNKVITLVSSARASKSKTQNLADRVAKWLTIISLTVGVGTFIFWLNKEGDTAFALERMVTVMVTACPHALGVAIPLVVAISTSLSATHGLLIRNRTAFESARKLSTIIFDKTGTLTKGSHEVQQIIPLSDAYSADELLQYAASVQQNSEHHIAHGLIRRAKEKEVQLWPVENFSYMQGVGVKGIVNGKNIVSAGPNYFVQSNQAVPVTPSSVDPAVETINYLLIDGHVAGIFSLADAIRESSAGSIDDLKKMHIKSYLLTGDNENIARSVAGKLKMDGYFANVLPHEKQEKLKEFQSKGEWVAMTGDGVNDAPALAQADVGIAVGSGTDVAAETADVILVNSDPKDIVGMIAFAKATYKKMIQNLVWAVGYNLVAIPLAAGILYPRFVLSPAMGAVLMSLSTIIVAFNAQLLKTNLTNK